MLYCTNFKRLCCRYLPCSARIALCVLLVTSFISAIVIYILFFKPLVCDCPEPWSSESLEMRIKYRDLIDDIAHNTPIASSSVESQGKMVVVVVSCGWGRSEQAFLAIKSAVVLAQSPIHIILYTSENYIENYKDILTSWPASLQVKFTYQVREAVYPSYANPALKELYRTCATFRLFLSVMLPDVDSILFIDSDILFLKPVDRLWDHFKLMNSSQMISMIPEHESPEFGWYNYHKIPHYPPLGLNAGVMLMNLTRMRADQFLVRILFVYDKYQDILRLADQDMCNILFCCHPEKVYLPPCEWNYRLYHCIHAPVGTCKSAKEHGVALVHGTYYSFTSKPIPVFEAIYQAWKNYDVSRDLQAGLIAPFHQAVAAIPDKDPCKSFASLFIASLESNLRLYRNNSVI